MSVGFGSVGEFAVGENQTGTGIELPVVAPNPIAVVGAPPDVKGGASVLVPISTLSLTGRTPAGAGGGSFVEVPVAEPIAIINYDGEVAGGGGALSPSETMQLIAYAPDVFSGADVLSPAGIISVLGKAPILSVGTAIDIPTGIISLIGNEPQVTHNANLLVPTAPLILTLGLIPDMGAGAFIDNPSRQDSYTSFGGGVAEVSVGEYGVGEGIPELTFSGRRVARLGLIAQAPTIQAGVLLMPPTGSIFVGGKIPEIDSRRRKLRSSAILS